MIQEFFKTLNVNSFNVENSAEYLLEIEEKKLFLLPTFLLVLVTLHRNSIFPFIDINWWE